MKEDIEKMGNIIMMKKGMIIEDLMNQVGIETDMIGTDLMKREFIEKEQNMTRTVEIEMDMIKKAMID